jgi:hypothetical protein
MKRVQFSLACMMAGVAVTALACAAARFTLSFAGWLLLPSLLALLIAAWATLLTTDRSGWLLVGLTVGGAAGWLLEMFAIILAGGGHGTYLPYLVFFSPFFLLSAVAGSDSFTTILFAAGPALYCVYGAAVTGSARSHWGPACIASILMFHYSFVAIALGVVGRGFYDSRMSPQGYRWLVPAAVLFAAIHVATVLLVSTAWRRNRRRAPGLSTAHRI